MTFEMMPVGDPARCGKNCLQVIVAEGEIADRTPQDFIDFIRKNLRDKRLRSVVFLHSPGGRVVASMKLGTALRQAGAATVVARPQLAPNGEVRFTAGRCFSACVYALMGGKKRVIPPPSMVGIHRMFAFEASADDTGRRDQQRVFAPQDVVARLADYSGMMGVSRELIYTAERINSDNIRIVSPAEIQKWKLGSLKF